MFGNLLAMQELTGSHGGVAAQPSVLQCDAVSEYSAAWPSTWRHQEPLKCWGLSPSVTQAHLRRTELCCKYPKTCINHRHLTGNKLMLLPAWIKLANQSYDNYRILKTQITVHEGTARIYVMKIQWPTMVYNSTLHEHVRDNPNATIHPVSLNFSVKSCWHNVYS